MDRKMRARRNNSEARQKKERRCSSPPVGIVFANEDSGVELTHGLIATDEGDIGVVRIALDHETKAFEVLPERSEMN